MKQYEPCIQNNNKNEKMDKSQNGKGRMEGEARGEGEKYFIFFSLIISQIYENRTVGFHRG